MFWCLQLEASGCTYQNLQDTTRLEKLELAAARKDMILHVYDINLHVYVV